MNWSDMDVFEPTMELRRFGVGDVLQQRWRKPKIGRLGHIVGWDYEWRAVPHVYGEDATSIRAPDVRAENKTEKT